MKYRIIAFITILLIPFSYLFGQMVLPYQLKSELSVKARDNIKALPLQKQKVYSEMIKKDKDGFITFFLASEESGKLLIADPEDLQKNREWIEQFIKNNPTNYSPQFFLSYLAKITVSDERISFYREEMEKKGLKEIREQNPNPEDRVRALNLWCKKYLTFESTSGRDMSPLDILFKTNVGRCEESQIFFVAAARTVGIPARPAFTPWWAHIDNNHAWAEVYVNGQWHYLGGCEPEYDLNRSWFTNLIDKAVLVISEAALPDSSEEILIKGKYMTYINSTSIYQSETNKAKKITVQTTYNGQPLKHVPIQIMVYNWGMLRSLVSVFSDSTGAKTFTTGQGAFYLLASQDSLTAGMLIPESANDTTVVLALSEKMLPYQDLLLTYPKPVNHQWTDNPDYIARRDRVNDEYNWLIKTQNALPFPDKKAAGDSLIKAIWTNCRFNKEPFSKFYMSHQPLDKEFLKAISLIDKKFFYQAKQEHYEKMFDIYQDTKKLKLKTTTEELANMINPTVYFEEIDNLNLKKDLLKWKTGDKKTNTITILRELKKRHTIYPESLYVNGLMPASYAMEIKNLTDIQFRTLFIGVLRQNLIPSDLAEVPGEVVISNNGAKIVCNIYSESITDTTNVLTANTGPNPPADLQISFRDEFNQYIRINDNQAIVTVLRDGIFYPLESQPAFSDSFIYHSNVFDGQYYLQVGYRVNEEKTYYQIVPIFVDKDSVITDELTLKEYPTDWGKIPENFMDLTSLIEPESYSGDLIVLLGDYDREMVHRLYNNVVVNKGTRQLVWIGSKLAPEPIMEYMVSLNYKILMEKNPALKSQLITLYYNKEKKEWKLYQGMWTFLPKE